MAVFDSATIKTLIQQAGPGGLVSIPPGVYSISETLLPLNGQMWMAAGAAFLKKMDGHAIQAADDWALSGLTLDGGYDHAMHAGPQGNGIFGSNVKHVTIDGCTFTRCGDAGVVFTGSRHATLRNCYVRDCGADGVYGCPCLFFNGDTQNLQVRGCTVFVRKGGAHGIAVHTEMATATVQGVDIMGNVIVNEGGGYCVEVGSFAAGGGEAQRPVSVSIYDNQCRMNANCSGGVSLDWASRFSVRGNHLSLAAGATCNAGIEAVNAYDCIVADNEMDLGGSGSIGVALDHELRRALVTGNVIRNFLKSAQGIGIAARVDAKYCAGRPEISDCVFTDNLITQPGGADSTGIRLNASAGVLRGITIERNRILWEQGGAPNSTGIGVSGAPGCTTEPCVIADNRFRLMTWGMWLEGVAVDTAKLTANQYDRIGQKDIVIK